MDTLLKRIVRDIPKPKHLENVDPNVVKLRLTDPQLLVLHKAAEAEPLLLDLEVKLLVSTKPLGLVLSDHPVAAYNQWAEHHLRYQDLDGALGLALRGLQWFLPLSPRVCLAIYDPGTYAYGSGRRRTCSLGMRDIRLLNTLQALSAHECLYFDPRHTSQAELDHLIQERTRLFPQEQSVLAESSLYRRPDGNLGQLIGIARRSPKIGKQFNFARITDRTPTGEHDTPALPIRSPELVELMNQWTQSLDAEIQRRAAAAKETAVSPDKNETSVDQSGN